MTDTKLKPCPFCGELPRLYGGAILNEESIDCVNDECPVQPTTGYRDWPDAVTAWNTRAMKKETTV